MGHEVVYCGNCHTRLTGTDFEKGTAFRIRDQFSCARCVRVMIAPLSLKEQEEFLLKIQEAKARKASGARLPTVHQESDAPAHPHHASSHMHRAPESSAMLQTLQQRSLEEHKANRFWMFFIPVLIGLAGGLVALFGLPQRTTTPRPPQAPPAGAPPAAAPAPAPDLTPREAAARAALLRAAEFARRNPNDLDGQIEQYKKATWESAGTSIFAEVKKESDALQKKQAARFAAAFVSVDEQMNAACARQAFAQALASLAEARKKYTSADWTSAIDSRVAQVQAAAWKAFEPLLDQAVHAQETGAEDEIKALRKKVDEWGIAALKTRLEEKLTPINTVPAPAPPAPVDDAYQAVWEKALSLAAARLYPEAIAELGKAPDKAAADIDILTQVARVRDEALAALAQCPPGETLAVRFTDEDGRQETLEGPVLRADTLAVELQDNDEPVAIPANEITAACLGEILSRRGKSDPRDLALLCLVEHDPEGAPKPAATDIPEKYRTWARQKAATPAEKEARTLLFAAETEFRALLTRGRALDKVLTLTTAHASTEVVRRNKALLAARLETAKEYFFFSEDLAAAGSFQPGDTPKVESCWTSQADSKTPQQNFIEAEFLALPGVSYRGWVYAGACCQETFAHLFQASDLVAPHPNNPKELGPAEPGSELAVPGKSSILSLRKYHAQHGGQKEPAKWDWVTLPLPKYSSPGLKKVRLLTNQKGFSVAYMTISSTRKEPPRESEVKELAKMRIGPRPAATTSVKPVFYRGIDLNGAPVKIDGFAWEGKAAGSFTFVGEYGEKPEIPLDPPTDDVRAAMIRSYLSSKSGTKVTLTDVPKGSYQVYLYVWDDAEPQTYDILVMNKVVLTRTGSGRAGHWEKLGPWTVSVTEGSIEVQAAKGTAHFSGIEVWSLSR